MIKMNKIIVENPIPITVFGLDGFTVELLNNSFTKLLGFTVEDIINIDQWNTKLFPNKDYRREVEKYFINEFEKVIKTNTSSNKRVVQFNSKSGEIFTIECSIIKDSNGIILFLKDTTDKQKLNEKRAKVESELKKLNKKLIEKNKELEQVVYVTSHDLRSPLINILGFSRELQMSTEEIKGYWKDIKIPEELEERLEGLIKEELPETARIISQSAIKMDTLLSALLRLSRSGRGNPNFQKLDMNKILDEISKENKFLLSQKEIKLEIEDLNNCIADSIQVNQIFSNLISNAINYSDASKNQRYISVSSYIDTDHVI